VSLFLDNLSVCLSVCLLLTRILRPIIWSLASFCGRRLFSIHGVATACQSTWALPVCLPGELHHLWASGLSSAAVCISWTYTNLPRSDKWEAGPFNRMCAVALSGECLRGESPLDRILAIPRRRLCLVAFGLSLVVAVLRDRL